jgi:ribosomal protein S6
VKRYEGLFILNTAGKEEALQETIDKISTEISGAGGKVETVQKMDKKHYARVANKKYTAGYYLNVIFNAAPPVVAQLRSKFSLNEDVFRVLFTLSPEIKPAK